MDDSKQSSGWMWFSPFVMFTELKFVVYNNRENYNFEDIGGEAHGGTAYGSCAWEISLS